MLVLAFVFMSGGLVPRQVAAPGEQLLVFPPRQINYPDVHPALMGGDIEQDVLPWHQWTQMCSGEPGAHWWALPRSQVAWS